MSDASRSSPVKVYLESRYRKTERGLPQTIFYCPTCKGDRRRAKGCEHCGGFGKLTKDSVQELIGRRILPAFKAKFGKFHGAGREDLDVLMLGRGRPFVYEVVGARNPDVDTSEIDDRIREACAGRIELDPFQRVGRERIVYWKESQFEKVYRAHVQVDGEFPAGAANELVGRTLDISQRTPARVAYRRADIERTRRVSIHSVGEFADGSFPIDIRCAHGTYVKEWISGDDARTTPSLASLLAVPCHCATLDVLDILTDEPSPHE